MDATTADPTNPSVDPSTYELKSKKPKKDFQDEVRELVPKAGELAEKGHLKEAIELMLGL